MRTSQRKQLIILGCGYILPAGDKQKLLSDRLRFHVLTERITRFSCCKMAAGLSASEIEEIRTQFDQVCYILFNLSRFAVHVDLSNNTLRHCLLHAMTIS